MRIRGLLTNRYRHLTGSILLLAACALSLGLGDFYDYSNSIDDAHITYYAGKTLAETGHILNYNGDPVEQSSSLLQVVLTAAASRLAGISVITAGHGVAIVSGLLCLLLIARLSTLDPLVRVLAIIQCTVSPALVYWQYAGLDATLAAACLLLLLMALHHYLEKPSVLSMSCLGVAAFMAAMSRPEMILFVPLCTAAIALVHWRLRTYTARPLVTLAIVGVLAAVLLVIWRNYYFGASFPQPVYAKVGNHPVNAFLSALGAVLNGFSDPRWLASLALVILATVYCLASAVSGKEMPLVTSLAVMQAGYMATILLMGKDWMPYGRFWVTLTPLLCISVTILLQRFLPVLLVWGFVVVIALSGINQARTIRNSDFVIADSTLAETEALNPAYRLPELTASELASPDNRANIPTLIVLLPLASQLLAEQPQGIHVLSGQMGFLSYHLASALPGKLRFLDRNGLVERSFTACMVTRDSARSNIGLADIPFIAFFRKADQLQQQCGIEKPELVYDIWNTDIAGSAENLLRNHGYRVVFVQQGHLNPGLSQLVAVREDLWQKIGSPPKRVIKSVYIRHL